MIKSLKNEFTKSRKLTDKKRKLISKKDDDKINKKIDLAIKAERKAKKADKSAAKDAGKAIKHKSFSKSSSKGSSKSKGKTGKKINKDNKKIVHKMKMADDTFDKILAGKFDIKKSQESIAELNENWKVINDANKKARSIKADVLKDIARIQGETNNFLASVGNKLKLNVPDIKKAPAVIVKPAAAPAKPIAAKPAVVIIKK